MKGLEVVKDDLASYLKIPSKNKEPFTYYTFHSQFVEAWDLIGLRYLKQDPLLVDLRLMHIEQEERDYDTFVLERDADGFLTFDPGEYLKIISFFEHVVLQKEVVDEKRPLTHFSLMSTDELLQVHYPQNLLHDVVGDYYRYLLDDEAQRDGAINVICLPHWSTRIGANQITDLTFTALTPRQLGDPDFNLLTDGGGLGTIRFNRQGLEELILLLKHRVFR